MAILLAITLFGCRRAVPEGLGPRGDRLSPCPSTPNCVNTGDRHPEGTVPIMVRDTASETWAAIVEVVHSMPRIRELSRGERYLHVEQRTPILRFVDDLELLLRPDRELVVRSASRIGRGDLGRNAERVDRLRKRLEEARLLDDR